jgi:hypothetical protein
MMKLPTFRKYRGAVNPHSKPIRKEIPDPEDEGNITTRNGSKYIPVDTA